METDLQSVSESDVKPVTENGDSKKRGKSPKEETDLQSVSESDVKPVKENGESEENGKSPKEETVPAPAVKHLEENELFSEYYLVCSLSILTNNNLRIDLHSCLLSPLKWRDIRWQNFTCRRMPSVCNTWTGSYVDRGHRYNIYSSNKIPFHLTEGKQNTKLAKCHTVPSAKIFTIQCVYGADK